MKMGIFTKIWLREARTMSFEDLLMNAYSQRGLSRDFSYLLIILTLFWFDSFSYETFYQMNACFRVDVFLQYISIDS